MVGSTVIDALVMVPLWLLYLRLVVTLTPLVHTTSPALLAGPVPGVSNLFPS